MIIWKENLLMNTDCDWDVVLLSLWENQGRDDSLRATDPMGARLKCFTMLCLLLSHVHNLQGNFSTGRLLASSPSS